MQQPEFSEPLGGSQETLVQLGMGDSRELYLGYLPSALGNVQGPQTEPNHEQQESSRQEF